MILCEFGGGSLSAFYSLRGRVTSRLDLRDNQKVITCYRNHGIIRILTDIVVSSGYLPGVLREAPSRVVLRKALSCGLGRPWWRSPCGLLWVSWVGPPTVGDFIAEPRCLKFAMGLQTRGVRWGVEEVWSDFGMKGRE
jgi:hypothetical protein